jgi:hypothetical protein
MIPNVCIRGSEKHAATVIKFLESLGGENIDYYNGEVNRYFYFVNSMGYVDWVGYEPRGKRLVTLEEARDFINGTIEYSKTPEFPRMMWVWDDVRDGVLRLMIHGHIPTIEYPWIDGDGDAWEHASDTDPLIPELTIEEAEAKFNIKIKR